MSCWEMIVDTMKVLFVYLVGKVVLRGWFSSVGTRTDVIKLAMAGTQDWWY